MSEDIKIKNEREHGENESENFTEQYDRVLYSEFGRGVLFVEKDGKYGVVDKVGKVIIPCKYKEYSDAWHEWADIGFASEPAIMTEEQKAIKQFEDGLIEKHDELIASGDIKSITFFNERSINGAEFVTMADGSLGIAASVIIHDRERGNNLEIKDADGKHVTFLSEPELFQGEGTPQLKICSDEDNLYAASYGNQHAYIACYRMGDFERVWKTPMYGSRLQSIVVNDSEIIVFDINDGKIKFFDKQNGVYNEDRDISTEKNEGISHHNLATTNERLLAGLSELKVFDNSTGESIAQKNISDFGETSQSLAVDQNNNRVFIASGNKIAVFSEGGYEGHFLTPTRNVQQLNFDQETGCLMISMTEGKGKVEVYKPNAIDELLQTSRNLESQSQTPNPHNMLDASSEE